MLTEFESRVLRQVHERIAEDQNNLRLSMDSVVDTTNAASTGMNLRHILGKISGLELALTHMKQVHAEMTGKAPKKKEQAA